MNRSPFAVSMVSEGVSRLPHSTPQNSPARFGGAFWVGDGLLDLLKVLYRQGLFRTRQQFLDLSFLTRASSVADQSGVRFGFRREFDELNGDSAFVLRLITT